MKKRIKSWMGKPVNILMNRLPSKWKMKMIVQVKKKLELQYAETEEELKHRAEVFLFREGMIVFWGICFLLITWVSLILFQYFASKEMTVERNSFGGGEKEISLILKKDSETKKYDLLLGEQKLSFQEEKMLQKEFFRDLEMKMRGNNSSLQKVTQALCFEESLDGWPFYITYQSENQQYIHMDGSIEGWEKISSKNQNSYVSVQVTAEYASYLWTKVFQIHLEKPERVKEESPFKEAEKMLTNQERENREKRIWKLPPLAGEISIEKEQTFHPTGMILIAFGILLFLLLQKFLDLKEKADLCKKETLRDFPVIVHLLTLYMGAGLSLSSAIQRIGKDYASQKKRKNKYAFEKILWMDQQIQLGAGQKEVCMQWGRKFKESAYRKLALTLSQVISKGTREGKMLMEQMEQEAFRQRIDQAKKEGEEASTRLLFPMILLLSTVLLLVMFPAIIRFQNF